MFKELLSAIKKTLYIHIESKMAERMGFCLDVCEHVKCEQLRISMPWLTPFIPTTRGINRFEELLSAIKKTLYIHIESKMAERMGFCLDVCEHVKCEQLRISMPWLTPFIPTTRGINRFEELLSAIKKTLYIHIESKMAERMGFEPTVELPPHNLSKIAP